MLDSKTTVGIGVINPTDIEPESLNFYVDEAIKRGINHIQVHGPMHHRIHSNIDGHILYKKYKEFNNNKDLDYIKRLQKELPPVLKKAKDNNIDVYCWHHEVEMPDTFIDAYPAILNETGDIEASSPIIADFINNKISDFFETYPDFAGLVITLHETIVPLLKLSNQKLSKKDRLVHICQLIIDAAARFDKKVIFRPFASLPEDVKAMSDAFNAIGEDLEIMVKWTKFDWSLHLPWNKDVKELAGHPLWIEGDLNGEYFGQGRIPCILGKHLKTILGNFHKEDYPIKGITVRTDRNYRSLLNQINDINLLLTQEIIKDSNVDTDLLIDTYITDNYSDYSSIKKLFKQSEDLTAKTLYIKGFYFSAGSFLPDFSAVKNHYWYDLINGEAGTKIKSNEWFVPKDYTIPSYQAVLAEKEFVENALLKLQDEFKNEHQQKQSLDKDKCKMIQIGLDNFTYLIKNQIAVIKLLKAYDLAIKNKDTSIFYSSVKEFESLNKDIDTNDPNNYHHKPDTVHSPVTPQKFISQVIKDFELEYKIRTTINDKKLIDYILPGSFSEQHNLLKEVNFSDVDTTKDGFARYIGKMGIKKESVNTLIGACGWVAYEFNYTDKIKTIAITFCAGSKPIEVDIAFNDNLKDCVTFKNDTPKDSEVFSFNIPANINSDFKMTLHKKSANPLGINLIKLLR